MEDSRAPGRSALHVNGSNAPPTNDTFGEAVQGRVKQRELAGSRIDVGRDDHAGLGSGGDARSPVPVPRSRVRQPGAASRRVNRAEWWDNQSFGGVLGFKEELIQGLSAFWEVDKSIPRNRISP